MVLIVVLHLQDCLLCLNPNYNPWNQIPNLFSCSSSCYFLKVLLYTGNRTKSKTPFAKKRHNTFAKSIGRTAPFRKKTLLRFLVLDTLQSKKKVVIEAVLKHVPNTEKAEWKEPKAKARWKAEKPRKSPMKTPKPKRNPNETSRAQDTVQWQVYIDIYIYIYKHTVSINILLYIHTVYIYIYIYNQGPKLRVTKAVMSKSYRFRSFAISIYMVLAHVKQWRLIWRSISIHLRRIYNRGNSGSAVWFPLFVFKVRKEFPWEQLGFALLRAFCFCRFCSSLRIFRSKLYSMVGFNSRLDHPK